MGRKDKYISYIESYPIKSVLMVLEEYEKKELYEECAIIKSALDEYNSTHVNVKKITKVTGKINFPTSLSQYNSESFQKTLTKNKIDISEKTVKEKASLIKLKLPIK